MPNSFSRSFTAYKTFLSTSDNLLRPRSFSIPFRIFFNSKTLLFTIPKQLKFLITHPLKVKLHQTFQVNTYQSILKPIGWAEIILFKRNMSCTISFDKLPIISNAQAYSIWNCDHAVFINTVDLVRIIA